MLLSARVLRDCYNVNSYENADSFRFTQGDVVLCYFQLIDNTLDLASENFLPAGRRYMPASGATLQVTVENIDDAKKIVRPATQPFPLDPSIWMVQFFQSDKTEGTSNLRLTLTEGSKVTKGILRNAFRVDSDRNC